LGDKILVIKDCFYPLRTYICFRQRSD